MPESTRLPFFLDIGLHVRFLLALPLLIVAELVVHQRISGVVRQFRERELVPDSHGLAFENVVRSSVNLRNSIWAEVFAVVLIYGIGYQFVWHETLSVDSGGWFQSKADPGKLSLAGLWFRWVSLPIWQFLFIRWYYRMFIWARFLFLIARMPLKLNPTHPDNAGGLGFLEASIHAFKPLAMAHGALLAGIIAHGIYHEGASLLNYKVSIALVAGWVFLMVMVPLLVFSGQLTQSYRKGMGDFSRLATRFSREFEAKWMVDRLPDNHQDLGGDIQSLADLSNAFRTVAAMKAVPVSRDSALSLIFFTILPIAPLVLTLMPLGEAVKLLAGLLF